MRFKINDPVVFYVGEEQGVITQILGDGLGIDDILVKIGGDNERSEFFTHDEIRLLPDPVPDNSTSALGALALDCGVDPEELRKFLHYSVKSRKY